MTRKKQTSDGDNLKILDLPKSKPKHIIVSSLDWLELSREAAELATMSAKAETLARLAKKAREISDGLANDFVEQFQQREERQNIFFENVKKILG